MWNGTGTKGAGSVPPCINNTARQVELYHVLILEKIAMNRFSSSKFTDSHIEKLFNDSSEMLEHAGSLPDESYEKPHLINLFLNTAQNADDMRKFKQGTFPALDSSYDEGRLNLTNSPRLSVAISHIAMPLFSVYDAVGREANGCLMIPNEHGYRITGADGIARDITDKFPSYHDLLRADFSRTGTPTLKAINDLHQTQLSHMHGWHRGEDQRTEDYSPFFATCHDGICSGVEDSGCAVCHSVGRIIGNSLAHLLPGQAPHVASAAPVHVRNLITACHIGGLHLMEMGSSEDTKAHPFFTGHGMGHNNASSFLQLTSKVLRNSAGMDWQDATRLGLPGGVLHLDPIMVATHSRLKGVPAAVRESKFIDTSAMGWTRDSIVFPEVPTGTGKPKRKNTLGMR